MSHIDTMSANQDIMRRPHGAACMLPWSCVSCGAPDVPRHCGAPAENV